MRPLNLTVEGFSCYGDAQPALDFEHLHLFAIAGPTGAGKSSILDAMMYALYGYVPRLGKAGADLITTGRDRLSVRFEFGVGERRYRVSRTVRRKSSAKVILEEIAAGGDSLLADKTSEANGAIERLLGIGYDGFSQSIVLPQGRFDTFLKSRGDDRRRLLKDLLGLERYELMRRSAVEDRSRLLEQVGGHQRLLAAFAHATFANLEQQRGEHAAARDLVSVQAEKLTKEEAGLAALRVRHQLTCELREKQKTIESLHLQTAAIEADRERISAARRVAPVLPRIEAAARTRQQSDEARRALERVRAEHKKFTTSLGLATESARQASIAAEQIAPLRTRIEALNRLHEVVVRVRSLDAQEQKLRSEVVEAAKLLKAASEQRARTEGAQAAKVKAADAARLVRDSVLYDSAVDALLQPLMSNALRGQELDKTVVLRRTAVSKANKDAAEAAQAVADEDQSAAALQATLARAVSSLALIDTELDSAKSARMARLQELQGQLSEGPVDAETLTAADGRWRSAQQEHLAAADAATRLASEVELLTRDVQKAEAASRDLQSARQRLDVSDTLARELGGDRFQQYLLHDTLCELVKGASVRLKALTNRYTLEWLDDQFYVVDHDNGRDQRIAHTLSGGETFMASLSLALELSDQILRSAGAVRIDSLFIDEGFGTLDSETLAVVADAIEALQVGGRMVGIITHLESLTERLPGCIRIHHRPAGGSRWAIERAG